MNKTLTVLAVCLGLALPIQLPAATALDLDHETSFTIENKLGKFEISLLLPKHIYCPITRPEDEKAGEAVGCIGNFRTKVTSLAPVTITSGPGFLGNSYVFQGQVTDTSGKVIGEWTSLFKHQVSHNPGWGTTYNRAHFAFKKTESGEVFFTGDQEGDANWSGVISQFKPKALSVTTMPKDLYNQAVAETERSQADVLAKRSQTVTCTKGKKSLKVTGDPATCPNGFSNSLAQYKAFQTFTACKLYKKGQKHTGVGLSKNGMAFAIRVYDYSSFGLEDFQSGGLELAKSDYLCAMKRFGVSNDIEYKLSQACRTQLSGTFNVDSQSRIEFSCDPRFGQTINFISSASYQPVPQLTPPPPDGSLSAPSVSISTSKGKWFVRIENAKGAQVSVRAGNRWFKFKSLSDNHLFSAASVVGSDVPLVVYVNGQLENIVTITVK